MIPFSLLSLMNRLNPGRKRQKCSFDMLGESFIAEAAVINTTEDVMQAGKSDATIPLDQCSLNSGCPPLCASQSSQFGLQVLEHCGNICSIRTSVQYSREHLSVKQASLLPENMDKLVFTWQSTRTETQL